MYLVRYYESRSLSDSVFNCVPIVRVPSQTTVFFTVMKPIQYIYQNKDHKTLVRNPRSIPQESPPFGRKATVSRWNLAGKVVIHREWWVWMDRSWNAEFKTGGVGWKAHRRWLKNDQNRHGCLSSHVACKSHLPLSDDKTQAWGHRQLLFLLAWHVHSESAWLMAKKRQAVEGNGDEMRERDIYVYTGCLFVLANGNSWFLQMWLAHI